MSIVATVPWHHGKPPATITRSRFCKCGKKLNSYNTGISCYSCQDKKPAPAKTIPRSKKGSTLKGLKLYEDGMIEILAREEPITAKQLAVIMGVVTSTMKARLYRMEKKGLIERKKFKQDGTFRVYWQIKDEGYSWIPR